VWGSLYPQNAQKYTPLTGFTAPVKFCLGYHSFMKARHDSETLAAGQQVIVASVFIHHKFDGIEKVFLARRASTKKFLPNVYEMIGGHIEYGEDIKTGLKREVSEEIGREVELGDPFNVMTYMNNIKLAQTIEITYFGGLIGAPSPVNLNPEDHSASDWFSQNESDKFFADRQPDDPMREVILKGFGILNASVRLKTL
jgi:8-oxo-dGTP diphosphatase